MGGRVIVRGIGLGALAMAIIVGIGAGWVWLYSVAIDPGHAAPYYQLYGQRVAPIVTIASGIPVLLLAGWLSGRGTPAPVAPLVPAITYVILDLVLAAVSGFWPPAWSLAVSYLTKFGAAWAGGAIGRRRRSP